MNGAAWRLPARLASSRAAVSSSTLRRSLATSASRARTRGQLSYLERLIRLLPCLRVRYISADAAPG